jgi:hypothetical protein
LIDGIKRINGKGLPAVCPGNPNLYILCKKDEKSMAVGMWNLFPDCVIDPVIELDEAYTSIDFYNASGSIDGKTVHLDKDIPPYGFVLFTVNL